MDGERRRGRWEAMDGVEEGPRNITVLIFHPGSRARRFAPVFNITPRSRMFYPPPSLARDRHFPPARPAAALLLTKAAAVSRLVTNLRY